MGAQDRVRDYHRRLAETLAAWPPVGPEPGLRRRYALRYGILHRVEAGEWTAADAAGNVWMLRLCDEQGTEAASAT